MSGTLNAAALKIVEGGGCRAVFCRGVRGFNVDVLKTSRGVVLYAEIAAETRSLEVGTEGRHIGIGIADAET